VGRRLGLPRRLDGRAPGCVRVPLPRCSRGSGVDATIHPSLTPGAVHGVGLSTSGEYIVTTGADSRLCMWSVHGEMLCELWRPFVYTCVECHARPAQAMPWQRKVADPFRRDVDWSHAGAWRRTGRRLCSAQIQGTCMCGTLCPARCWRRSRATQVRCMCRPPALLQLLLTIALPRHAAPVTCIYANESGSVLVTGAQDGSIAAYRPQAR
jgi:hypothetical protein